jgi:CIC family chloride channel protein
MLQFRWSRWLRPGSGPGFLLLALVVGAGAGVGAAILIRSLEYVESLTALVAKVPALSNTWMLLTVPVGMVIAGLITDKFAPEIAGHGVPQIIAALATRGGQIRARVPILKTIATALTIGGGGSAGREGSIAQIGAGFGSLVAETTRVSEHAKRSLVAAGAGAGIAATFNAPIAGMFFAMEVVLRDLSVKYLHAVVLASVAAAVVSHSLIGEGLTFQVSPYSLDDPWQLTLFAVLGLITFALALFYIDAIDWFQLNPNQLKRWLRPLGLGMLVAVIGFALPHALGTGQPFIQSILSEQAQVAWWLLGLLAVAKVITTSATLGGRGAGGIFMPSLFIGAMAGSAFAQLSALLWQRSVIHPGAFALVGMAAAFAGAARAPLTAILIVFEITGDYGLVMPLMLAVAISVLLANRFHPASVYTSPLLRMGIHPRVDHADLLDTVTVGNLGLRSPVTVEPATSLTDLEGLLNRNRLHGVPVVDGDELVGIVTHTDILRAGGASDQVSVEDAMTKDPVTVTMDLPVSDTLERMAALGVGRLPVVDEDDPHKLIAMFRREDAVAAYHLALGSAARRDRMPERANRPRVEGTGFFDFEILPESAAAGRRIREIPWPESCLVVSVHRGNQLLVASGELTVEAGDALTIFGDLQAQKRLRERLGAPT